MLNIGKLAPGGGEYYLASVASSVEAYYTGAGEAPGRWVGAGAQRLGLAGLVSAETLRAVLAGVDPADERPLVGSARSVPGFDLTFRAPKSVSLLWALADTDVSGQVRRAHDVAVVTATDYLERHAAFARRGKGGREQVDVDGFVAAAFQHRTSRADDPLLHTHVLVANLAHTADDGRWRTLDARHLYLHAKTAGYLYQAQLRAELTRRLDVAFTPVANGCADLAGVPRPVIEAFSRRRADILAALATRGEGSARAAQVATLATRTAKTHTQPDQLRDGWRHRATDLGFGRRQVAAVTRQRHGRTDELENRRVQARQVGWLLGPAGLTRRASTFTRRDALRGWCEQLVAGADITEVERRTDRLLADTHPGTIRLADPVRAGAGPSDVGAEAGGIRLDDGRVIAVGVAEARYTTPELLALERQLVASAVGRLATGQATVPAAIVDRVLGDRPGLSGEQRRAVTQLTSSGHGVEVLVGRAGTGKTYTLGAARHAWEQAGRRVVGCALAARAARQLQVGAGIQASTIDRLLTQLARPGGGLPAGGVLVVDEAGMVGTRTLARLADAAATSSTKLVLVGDHHQLPELDAGGSFAGLAARLPACELTTNRRQRHSWEIDALAELRAGDLTTAVTAYRDHHRLVTADTTEVLREQLVADWWHARSEHAADAVMVAARGADLDDLNARARVRLAQAGALTGPSLQAAGREFQVGERVLCLRNQPGHGVLNGTRGHLTHVDAHRRRVTLVRDDNGEPVSLAASYLDAGHLTHGYALTAHKAQGLTCDATFVLGSDVIYREWGYVALSRGCHHNRLYLVSHETDEPVDDPTHPQLHQHDARTPAQRLVAALHTSRRQTLALDHPAATPPAAPPASHEPATSRDEGLGAPAGHLTRALGPRPTTPASRRVWDQAAAAIDAHRAAHGIDDPDRPLGLVPTDAEQRAAHRQAMRELLAARRELTSHRPPQPEPRAATRARAIA